MKNYESSAVNLLKLPNKLNYYINYINSFHQLTPIIQFHIQIIVIVKLNDYLENIFKIFFKHLLFFLNNYWNNKYRRLNICNCYKNQGPIKTWFFE